MKTYILRNGIFEEKWISSEKSNKKLDTNSAFVKGVCSAFGIELEEYTYTIKGRYFRYTDYEDDYNAFEIDIENLNNDVYHVLNKKPGTL